MLLFDIGMYLKYNIVFSLECICYLYCIQILSDYTLI